MISFYINIYAVHSISLVYSSQYPILKTEAGERMKKLTDLEYRREGGEGDDQVK